MKQHITPKQAKDITKEGFYKLFPDLVVRDDWANYHHKKITIGKMIEIIETRDANYIQCIFKTPNSEWACLTDDDSECCTRSHVELCDELWEILKMIL